VTIDPKNMPLRGMPSYWRDVLTPLVATSVDSGEDSDRFNALRVVHGYYGNPGVLDFSTLLLLYAGATATPEQRTSDGRVDLGRLIPAPDAETTLRSASQVSRVFDVGPVTAEILTRTEHHITKIDEHRELVQQALNKAGLGGHEARRAVRAALSPAEDAKGVSSVFTLALGAARATHAAI
jgi:hypothetical protein